MPEAQSSLDVSVFAVGGIVMVASFSSAGRAVRLQDVGQPVHLPRRASEASAEPPGRLPAEG